MFDNLFMIFGPLSTAALVLVPLAILGFAPSMQLMRATCSPRRMQASVR